MDKIKVGSEIQRGDRRFEVIGFDDVNDDLSHVMLSNGNVVVAAYESSVYASIDPTVHIRDVSGEGASDELWLSNLSHYGIIPLVEIVSEPIEFVCETLITDDYVGAFIPVPLGYGLDAGVRFRCVQEVD
jgi:hypothetical protein